MRISDWSSDVCSSDLPQQVTKTLGADVLRLWVAASDYSGEIAISDKLLARMADAYRRIRNTARYLLGSFKDFDPATDLVAPDQLEIGRASCRERVRRYVENSVVAVSLKKNPRKKYKQVILTE